MGMKIHGKSHPLLVTVQNPAMFICVSEQAGVWTLSPKGTFAVSFTRPLFIIGYHTAAPAAVDRVQRGACQARPPRLDHAQLHDAWERASGLFSYLWNGGNTALYLQTARE